MNSKQAMKWAEVEDLFAIAGMFIAAPIGQ
jgi:hypothetical protein